MAGRFCTPSRACKSPTSFLVAHGHQVVVPPGAQTMHGRAHTHPATEGIRPCRGSDLPVCVYSPKTEHICTPFLSQAAFDAIDAEVVRRRGVNPEAHAQRVKERAPAAPPSYDLYAQLDPEQPTLEPSAHRGPQFRRDVRAAQDHRRRRALLV
jgi:hypothetical protein